MTEMKVTLVRPPLGDDLAVVNAARVSFDKESEWVEQCSCGVVRDRTAFHQWPGCGTDARQCPGRVHRSLSERDAKLIRYLAKHGHWSPFAHTAVQLRLKAPLFVARQLQKHEVGFVWNEISRRYVDFEPEFWEPLAWRKRADSAKQGSGGPVDPVVQKETDRATRAHNRACLARYNTMLADGICPEQARSVLPQSMMTEWIWTGNVYGFSRVCRQRLDPHAQAEVGIIAQQIAEIVEPLFPVSWKELMA